MIAQLNKHLLSQGINIPSDPIEYGRLVLENYRNYFSFLPDDVRNKLFSEAIAIDPQLIASYGKLPEEITWKLIRQNPKWIQYIQDPTIDMCKYVLDIDPHLAHLINANACRLSVICFLVNYDIKKLALIPSVPKDVQLLAVKKDLKNIGLLSYPCSEACAYVLERDHGLFHMIRNPPDDICLLAFNYDIRNIKYIHRPTSEMINRVIEEDPLLARNIKAFLPDDFCDTMLDEHGCFIERIKSPSQEQAIRAFNTYPDAIVYISNPSEEMCWKAITHDAQYFGYIANLATDEMKWYMLKNHQDDLSASEDFTFDLTEDMIYYLMENCPNLLSLTDAIPEKLCYEILDMYPNDGLKYILCPSKAVCRAALERSTNNLKYVDEGETEIILEALQKDPKLIYRIYYPSPLMCFVALILDPESIHLFRSGASRHGYMDEYRAVAIGEGSQKPEYLEACKYLGLIH